MKMAWIFIRSAVQIFTQMVLYWPLVLLALANFICHFSLWAVILLVVSLLSAFLVNLAILSRHDANINRELFSMLTEYPNYRFEKRDMKELVNRYASYDVVQGMLYQNNLREIGEVYVAVLEDRSVKKRFLNPKSFPRVYFSNVVIIPENMENGDIMRQFLFFHELGHLTTNHTKLHVLGIRSVIGAVCTFFIGVCLFPWYITLALIPFVRIWHGSCAGLSLMISHESGEIERLADGFALKILQNHPALKTLEDIFSRSDRPRLRQTQESMDFFKDWFKDTRGIDTSMEFWRNFWSKHFLAPEDSQREFFVQHGLSSKAVNYNTMIETRCFPYYFWPAYCLCALLVAGCVLREPTTVQYILLSVAPLLVSAIAAFRYASRMMLSAIMTESKLKGDEIPAPTEKWKKRLEKSVVSKNGRWQKVKEQAAAILVNGEERKPLT